MGITKMNNEQMKKESKLFVENMKRQQNMMRHIIEIDGLALIVSEHVKPSNVGGLHHKFIDNLYHDGYEIEIQKIATCPTPGSFVYLYQITNINDGEIEFMIVNNKKYYDENGYFDEIVYDKKMKSDNTLDAYREFATEIESEF